MNPLRIILTVSFLVPLAACESGSKHSIDINAEAAKLMAKETEWSDMLGAKDLDGVMSLFARNAVVLPPGQSPIIGLDAIRADNQAGMEAEGVDVSFRSTAAFVAPSGDMAYDYGATTVELADGTVTDGNYLVVWTREDGQWKVAADIYN